MPRTAPAIATTNLTKRYGSIVALDAIDIQVPAGVTYGFLGPNGAGKTTTIRLLMGFIRPSQGSALIHGHDCWHDGVRARANVGYLIQADALYQDMTGRTLLDYMAGLSHARPVLRERLLDALELGNAALGRRLRTYSKGMKQKLALTAAIQTQPSLLILDEPTDGLDPLIQRAFEQVLAEVHAQGSTIFMSSHDLAEVERTCERVAIIREGRIVAEETIAELSARQHRIAEVTFTGIAPPALRRIPGLEIVHHSGARVVLSLQNGTRPLIDFLAGRDDVADLVITRPSLEDIFMGYYEDTGLPRPGSSGHTPATRVSASLESIRR